MAKAARVFIIIGMVLGAPLVFPLVVGIFSLRHLNAAKTSESLKAWGIITLFLVSVLGGVFMLLIKDEELASCQCTFGSKQMPREGYVETYLINLEKLYKSGVIDQKTYLEKRKQFVEEQL